MGKYALENYSPYVSHILRPKPGKESPDNIGRGQVNYLNYSWEELEEERGVYHIEVVRDGIRTAQNPVLVIVAKAPAWLKGFPSEAFSSLIRRVGSYLQNEKNLVGVIITSLNQAPIVWDAYIAAFDQIPLMAELHNKELICYLKEKGVNFGLVVTCNEDNWLDCCEAFARLKVQNTWEKAPVLLKALEGATGEHVTRESGRWHVGFSDTRMDVGYQFFLRRVTYPKQVSSGGALPVRFWFVNAGSAPCYRDFALRIKLIKGKKEYVIHLHRDKKSWQLGDITHNEIVQLPEMEPGTYTVHLGIFFDSEVAMKLCIESEADQGYYELGEIEIDLQDRKELFHIWDDFYPEGYYPLEDPQVPN